MLLFLINYNKVEDFTKNKLKYVRLRCSLLVNDAIGFSEFLFLLFTSLEHIMFEQALGKQLISHLLLWLPRNSYNIARLL